MNRFKLMYNRNVNDGEFEIKVYMNQRERTSDSHYVQKLKNDQYDVER